MATAAPMVGEVFGQYRIIRVLGKGGMAIVYEAEDLNLGRRVALKFLPEVVRENDLALERFRREARAASALNHPNICTIYGVEESTDRAFIAMELIEGATLKEVIRANRLGEVGMIVDASIQIADALAAAHAKGIIHRDVKPSNILVTEHGLVKILDFGLAKATLSAGANSLDDSPTLDSSDDHLTSPGSTLGTIAYMSPEQVRGRELDARTDLFSMGVVLYEMCTRTLPFDGETAGVIFEAILNRVPAPVSELNNQIPAQLEAIIFKALEKDRDVRYQSAADIRADLRRIKRDLQTDLSSGAGGASVRQTRSKARPATTISITLVGLLALAFLFFSVNRGKRTSNAADHPSGPKSLTASSLAFGTVLVNTNVDDAAVFVDGQKMAQISGKTTTLNLSGGKHDIRLEKEGFQSAGIMIEVTEHFQTQLQLTLLPVSLQLSPMSVEDTEPIRELIEYKFKNAYESQDVTELRRIWPSVSDQLVDAVKNSRGIDLYLKCNPEASNTEAMARCNEYAILNQKTLKASIVTFHLKKVGPDWQIVSSQ